MSLAVVLAAAGIGIALGGFAQRRARAGRAAALAADKAWRAFAAERSWTYLPHAPLRRDFRFLDAGTQLTGRGFVLEVDGRRWSLYEHVRITGSGDHEVSTRFVVLAVNGVRPHADGMRIRAKQGYDLIPGPSMRRFELESIELADNFVVEVPAAMPEERVREVLTPQAIVDWLALAEADCYLGEYAEIQVDSLLLAGRGSIDAGDEEYLDETVRLARPVVAHLGAS